MKSVVLILTTAIIAATLCNAAQWEHLKVIDPITDQVSHLFWTYGTELSCANGQFCPKLAIRITPKNADVFLFSPAIKRNEKQASIKVTSRFDSDAPDTSIWCGSDNRCALFCEDPSNTIKRLRTATKLSIQFAHNGFERTSTFDTSGFSKALAKTKIGLRPQAPNPTAPTKRTAAASKPPCRKCKGKGIVSSWVNCPKCGGQRCRSCVNSVYVGKVRGDVPCPVCRPNDTTANLGSGFGSNGSVTYAAHGYSRAMRAHIRNQVNAEIMAETDALAFGYHDEVKNWTKAKRLTNQKK